jgi:AsmA protein
LDPKPGDKTAFTDFAGNFAITNGVAQNQDLHVTAAPLRVSGAGSIDLVQHRIDYTVRAKVEGGPADQSGAVSLAGLEVPLHVTGPWEKPSVKPDVKAVLKSEQTSEALKRIGKNLKSPDVQDAIKDLLGGGEGQQKVKPRELLEKLLKKE